MNATVIDIHCHMIPGIDDGPGNLEAALALAKACADDGITHAVLTPHVFPGRFENRRSNIEDDFNAFAAVLRASGIPLTVSWAGEVRLTPEVLDLLVMDEVPWLGTSDGLRNMLLEMPDGQVPLGADTFVKVLLRQGIRPVIVHPERNKAVMAKPERLRPFVDMGCLVQVTAGSLVGQFGEQARSVARQLLDDGWVHVVASDSHNLKGRAPRMRDARALLVAEYGLPMAFALMAGTPAKLCGLPVPPMWVRQGAGVGSAA